MRRFPEFNRKVPYFMAATKMQTIMFNGGVLYFSFRTAMRFNFVDT